MAASDSAPDPATAEPETERPPRAGAAPARALPPVRPSDPAETLSVVIPTLNAQARLPGCLGALRAARAAGVVDQVIVVDGGSTDRTRQLARELGAIVIDAPPGRGSQLAAGASAASGGWLLFLHADTRLAPGWERALAAHLADDSARHTAAAFRLAFDEVSDGAERVARLANWRARRLGLPYGDQGLVIARGLYDEIGGYRALALMEDVDLVRRLGRRRIRLLDAVAVTSAARYRRDGWWVRPARNLGVLALYLLGVPLRLIRRLYG
jgi:rSAM/selenodomain-associated transferase 2